MLATGQFTFEILVVNAVLYTFGALGIHQLVFEDMTYELRMTNRRLEAAREELLQAAITDPLTGCHNRRFLEQVMDRELQRHARFQLPLSLLFIDVDQFKQINDTLGHEAGDRVLQYVARFLKRYIREADYVFRWGGDEFLVLITCGAEEAARKAAVLKASFDAAPEAVELPPGIGLSVGWAEVPPGTDRSPAAGQGSRRADVRRQGTGRGVARDVDAQGASGARQEELARYRIARRPPTSGRCPRRPSPSAARRRRRGSSSRRSCRTPGRESPRPGARGSAARRSPSDPASVSTFSRQ